MPLVDSRQITTDCGPTPPVTLVPIWAGPAAGLLFALAAKRKLVRWTFLGLLAGVAFDGYQAYSWAKRNGPYIECAARSTGSSAVGQITSQLGL